MPKFSEALDRFKKDGFFELDTKLYTEQIEKLKLCARFLREDNPEIPFYQFHLSHVQFVPGYLPRPERVVNGVVVEHHAQRDWHPGIPDVALLQMARSASAFNMGLRFNEPNALEIPSEEQLKSALYSLLNQAGIWSSIKIDWVSFFCDNEARNYLNADFHNDLLERLTEQAATSLKELSLKPFSLSNSLTALVNFLTRSADLEILHLEIIDATRDEWLELARVLAVCRKLKSLNLGNTLFDENAYSALSTLLDENYRIKRINVGGPIGNRTLMKAYNQLNQRLSKPRRARFKEERLSQEVLLELAFQTLIEREKIQLEQLGYMIGDGQENKKTLLMKRVGFLLSDQGTRAITETEKVTWLKGAYVLPTVYLNHKEYMKEFSSLFQLHLGELVLDGTNTVGHLLLERAFEVRDTQMIQCLLESKADMFEAPSEEMEKPFLVRLFETEGPWQELVIQHLKKDLNDLVPAVKTLSPYSGLEPICNELKEHLNTYFSLLENRKKQPKLLRLLNGVMSNFQDRQEECAQSFHNLVWYIKVATDEAVGKKVTYDSLFEAQEILEQILEDSRQANRGFWGRSKLHDDLLRLGKELNKQLKLHQRELYYHEKNNSILYLTDGREKDNAEFEKMRIALAKEQKEREQERERHAQERERHAQEQKEREQEKAEMEAKIEELKRLVHAQKLAPNQPSAETAPQDQERLGGSTHFFSRR